MKEELLWAFVPPEVRQDAEAVSRLTLFFCMDMIVLTGIGVY